jgi:hypothetical protein
MAGEGKKTEHVGDDLLSHEPKLTLPSALAGLTAGFEMGPGVPPPLLSPTYSVIHFLTRNSLSYNRATLLLVVHALFVSHAFADTLKTV